jgi:hypothetical protein
VEAVSHSRFQFPVRKAVEPVEGEREAAVEEEREAVEAGLFPVSAALPKRYCLVQR